jgi:hypothetical protein
VGFDDERLARARIAAVAFGLFDDFKDSQAIKGQASVFFDGHNDVGDEAVYGVLGVDLGQSGVQGYLGDELGFGHELLLRTKVLGQSVPLILVHRPLSELDGRAMDKRIGLMEPFLGRENSKKTISVIMLKKRDLLSKN